MAIPLLSFLLVTLAACHVDVKQGMGEKNYNVNAVCGTLREIYDENCGIEEFDIYDRNFTSGNICCELKKYFSICEGWMWELMEYLPYGVAWGLSFFEKEDTKSFIFYIKDIEKVKRNYEK